MTDRRKINQEYYSRNKEKEKKRCLEYYHKNKDRIDRDKKKEYMKEYLKTYERKKPTQEQIDEKNRKRRERYASDSLYREKEKKSSRQWAQKNPDKKLNQKLKESFNISIDDYKRILDNQNNVCAICGTSELVKTKKRMNVDHCHKSGKIRGILCHHCNFGLGRFKDNTELLLKAIKYLKDNSIYEEAGE